MVAFLRPDSPSEQAITTIGTRTVAPTHRESGPGREQATPTTEIRIPCPAGADVERSVMTRRPPPSPVPRQPVPVRQAPGASAGPPTRFASPSAIQAKATPGHQNRAPAPPPTRFAPTGTVQAKAPPTAHRPPQVLPPPTRFGPTGAVQAKAHPPAHHQLRNPPPPTRFGPTGAVQAKASPAANRSSPVPPPTRFGAGAAATPPAASCPGCRHGAAVVQRMDIEERPTFSGLDPSVLTDPRASQVVATWEAFHGQSVTSTTHPAFVFLEIERYLQELRDEDDEYREILEGYDLENVDDLMLLWGNLFSEGFADELDFDTTDVTDRYLSSVAKSARAVLGTASFSGSSVFTAGVNEVRRNNPFVFKNSVTGFVGKKVSEGLMPQYSDVKTLSIPSTHKTFKRFGGKTGTKETTGHAETNVYRLHKIDSITEHHSIEDIPLTIATNIAHCVECWWAAHKIFKTTSNFHSATACGNKLFKNWGEPWAGFYQEYGASPFRGADGKLQAWGQGLLGDKACIEVDPSILNNMTGTTWYK